MLLFVTRLGETKLSFILFVSLSLSLSFLLTFGVERRRGFGRMRVGVNPRQRAGRLGASKSVPVVASDEG